LNRKFELKRTDYHDRKITACLKLRVENNHFFKESQLKVLKIEIDMFVFLTRPGAGIA